MKKVGHTWTPYCATAAYGIGSCTFKEALKMYSALYIFNQIFGQKYDIPSSYETLRSILQSSFFLGFNAYSVMMIFCGSRRVLGKFYYPAAAHLPAIIGSYMSILLERKSRRSALSFYVANIATETIWNKIVSLNLIKPIPYGEVYLFSLSTAGMLYLIQRNGFGHDPVSFGLKYLLGSDYARTKRRKTKVTNGNNIIESNEVESMVGSVIATKEKNDESLHVNDNLSDYRGKDCQRLSNDDDDEENDDCAMNGLSMYDFDAGQGRRIINSLGNCPASIDSRYRKEMNEVESHCEKVISSIVDDEVGKGRGKEEEEMFGRRRDVGCCSVSSHSNYLSCFHYSCHGLVRNFLLTSVGHSVVSLLMSPKTRNSLFTDPINVIIRSFTSTKSISLGLFVGLYSGIIRLSSCLLKRYTTLNDPQIGFLSGIAATPAAFFWTSSSLAQYMMWKLIETCYFLGVKSGHVKQVELTLNLLYAVSTAQLFYVSVIEPKMLRPSYTKWLNRVTHGYFALLNRNLIDILGTQSSFGYPIFYPDLEPEHISTKFKESVLVWLI